MRTALLMLCCATIIAACGVKRPLVAPKDIPAYEQKQQQKLERKQQFEQEQLQQRQNQAPQI